MWAAIKWKWTHRFLIWLDDKLKYGVRNPTKRWWFDLERVGDDVVRPLAGTNERDLHLDKAQRSVRPLAVYPPEKLPRADQKEPVPLDRKQGIADGAEAERMLRELKESRAGG
jgi:hypothetical protein